MNRSAKYVKIKNMTIQETIKEQIKDAMKAKDEVRLTTLRGLSSAFVNELVAKGKKPNENISDDDALSVIKRQVKQRRDSIEQFTKGNRPDLVEHEQAELKVVEEFMPQMASEKEIKKVSIAKKEELGITDKSKTGILMGAVMKEFKGTADGALVKAIVESLF